MHVFVLQIGVEGAKFMADALRYNSTLSTLDLRANALGDEVGPSVLCTFAPRDELTPFTAGPSAF